LKKALKAERILTEHQHNHLEPCVAARQDLRACEKTQKELQQRRQQLQQQQQLLQQEYQQQQQLLLREEEQCSILSRELRERVQQAKEEAESFWSSLPAQQEFIRLLQQQQQQLQLSIHRKRERHAALLLAVEEAQQQIEASFCSYLSQMEKCRRALPPPATLSESLANIENEPPTLLLQLQQQQQQEQQKQQQEEAEEEFLSAHETESNFPPHKPWLVGAPN
ncbi:hypothetical protein ETH_00032515, partial [Eimeria tenella]